MSACGTETGQRRLQSRFDVFHVARCDTAFTADVHLLDHVHRAALNRVLAQLDEVARAVRGRTGFLADTP